MGSELSLSRAADTVRVAVQRDGDQPPAGTPATCLVRAGARRNPWPMEAAQNSPELADEVSGLLVGGGILTMALFPFALPLVLLTVTALVPLVLLAIPVSLVVAVVWGPILLVRRLRRAAA